MDRYGRKRYHDEENHLEATKEYTRRLASLYGILAICLLLFIGVLYNAQVINGSYYYSLSSSRIPTTETVEASRGILTDRNGKVLVSNRQIYTITFDTSLLSEDSDPNEAILRLIELCEEHGITWEDNLPISPSAPFRYTTDTCGETMRNRFNEFLSSCGYLAAPLSEADPHPILNAQTREDFSLTRSAVTPTELLNILRSYFSIDENLPMAAARKIIGVRYELAVRTIVNTTAYVFAEDVDAELIAILTDGKFEGVVVGSAAKREYSTEYAAHLLGRIGYIDPEEYPALKEQGYPMDALIGKDGAEKAFEQYLRGTDGVRMITTNEEGKITGELYSKEPVPGGTTALTIDIDLQEASEKALAATIEEMTAKDGITSRGGAAAVVQVGTGDILTLASYPTYDLATYESDNMDGNPFVNRAIQGTYAPGSTYKMVTAVAGLETGVISPSSKIRTTGIYTYYAPSYTPRCWIYRQGGGSHGSINVSQALYHSCNYFFYDVGRKVGISTLSGYAAAFGLGQRTGIELAGERTGVLAGPEYSASVGALWYDGNTLQAAIGQGDNLFTPLQLANYVATLVGGGERYNAHLLKSVKSYDNTSVLYLYDEPPISTVEMSPSTLEAVKEGMGDLVKTGSISSYFKNCVVSAGAKTGSAQTGGDVANGVFVCFAPFEDPEIAVALVIEKGGSGAALASTAVEIINAYYRDSDVGMTVVPENALLP